MVPDTNESIFSSELNETRKEFLERILATLLYYLKGVERSFLF